MSRFLWPTARYAIAAIGIAALGIRSGSWVVFAPIALLALAQSIRTGAAATRAISDHRSHGWFAEDAVELAAAGRYAELLGEARRVAAGSRTNEFRVWGLEWAAYAAIKACDSAEMRDLLSSTQGSEVPPHVPGQLYAALGEHEAAVPFLEASLRQRRDEAATLSLVQTLAATGDVDAVEAVLARAAKPTTPLGEWVMWCKLEQEMVEEAAAITEMLDRADMSTWGMSLCQVAMMRIGDHEASLAWGDEVLEARPHPTIESVVRYNRACSLAQLGRDDAALQELGQVNDGDLLRAASQDQDLESLWPVDEFKRIVAGAGRSNP